MPDLSWVCFKPAVLKLSVYLLPLGFYLSLTSVNLTFTLTLGGWVARWLAPSVLLSLFSFTFFFPQISPSIYTRCLPDPPILSSGLLLDVQLFIRSSGILAGQETWLHRVKQMQCKQKQHIFTSLNKCFTA